MYAGVLREERLLIERLALVELGPGPAQGYVEHRHGYYS
jgi:hypothetical protein